MYTNIGNPLAMSYKDNHTSIPAVLKVWSDDPECILYDFIMWSQISDKTELWYRNQRVSVSELGKIWFQRDKRELLGIYLS